MATSALMRYLGCAFILHQSWLDSLSRPHQGRAPGKCTSELIPRHVLFGNPEVRSASLSPDGRFLAYLKPWEGVLNIFTLSVEDSLKQDGLVGGRQLTFERKPPPIFDWTHQPGVLLYGMDNDGDENWRIIKANASDGSLEAITEGGKSRATVYKQSKERPDVVVISLNDEDPRYANLYYVNLVNGSRWLCFNNSAAQMRQMFLDSQLRVRLTSKTNDDASESYFRVLSACRRTNRQLGRRGFVVDEIQCNDYALSMMQPQPEYLNLQLATLMHRDPVPPQKEALQKEPRKALSETLPGNVEFSYRIGRLLERILENREDRAYYDVPFEEIAFHGVLFVHRGDDSKIIWMHGLAREFPELVVKPLEDPGAEGELLYAPKSAEITRWAWPASKDRPLFVVEDPGRPIKTLLDLGFKEVFEFLQTAAGKQGAEWDHMGYSEDLRTWLIRMNYDDASFAVYFFFPSDLSLRLLYVSRPELARYRLAKMHSYTVDTEDGLKMACYLSIPRMEDVLGSGIPLQPLPTVLKVHGGPWSRSRFGFSRLTQWLVNRDYAVLDCNYRISTGFGKTHFYAGVGEWGGAMHSDLLEAVDWAVKLGVSARDRVAVYGWSYGGYAALVGATFTPDVFACAVDVVGPSNLTSFMDSFPDHWTASYNTLRRAIGGGPETAEGRAFLASRSPITFVDRIRKPLLVVQGANDVRVPIRESQQIVDAMKAKDIPVTYVVFPDEGHNVRRPENKEALWYVVETFLQGCLGGRAEAAAPGLLENSTAQVRETGGLDLPQWTPPNNNTDG